MRLTLIACGGAMLTLLGCTVGWYDLRGPISLEADRFGHMRCPISIHLLISSVTVMNTSGVQPASSEHLQALRESFLDTTEAVLSELGCRDTTSDTDEFGGPLTIKIDERQQLSALSQEYLTGLSLGLIPSWGTRPSEFRFEFSSQEAQATYAVDEKRINHILLTPVFWLSLLLTDEQVEYETALKQFLSRL